MRRKSTPLLPNFPHRFGRPRTPRLTRLKQEFAEAWERPLAELQSLFAPWVDSSELAPTASKANSRSRTFSLEVVFWGFLFQVLAGIGCSGAVSKVQSWLVRCGRTAPSSNTSAYCQGRNRLPMKVLHNILDGITSAVTRRLQDTDLWFGHRVKVVDGTGLSAADTAENQAEWPQSSNMKRGCGFPQLNLVGLFCLHTGVLLGWKEGNKHNHETRLWRKLWDLLEPGDLVLGDRAFGSFAGIAALKLRGVDTLMRLHGARKVDWRRGKRLGKRDRLQVWTRPRSRGKGWTKKQWAGLPSEIEVRVIERGIEVPGFRTEKVIVVTTLTEPSRYPADELVRLYRRRWAVELFLRDIKITLGMDVLKCKSPAMVRKELIMYLICYNLLRAMMQQAARQGNVCIERISFTVTAQKLHEWLPLVLDTGQTHTERRRRLLEFYRALATAPVPDRPDRVEPRVRKRRPKNYRLMTRPRGADKLAKTI
jgi:hypothetical protein